MQKVTWAHFRKEVRLNVQSPQQKVCLLKYLLWQAIDFRAAICIPLGECIPYFDYRQGTSKPCVHIIHDFLGQALEDNVISHVFPCGPSIFDKQAFIVSCGYASHFFVILSGRAITSIEVVHHCSSMPWTLGSNFFWDFFPYSNPSSCASMKLHEESLVGCGNLSHDPTT